jgi:hypothetical protein
VTPRVKVLGDQAIGREEALGVTRGLEALQAPFALAGGLVRVFGAISTEISPENRGYQNSRKWC